MCVGGVGGITVYSLIPKSGKLGLDMHIRLHEQLYVKFQFYTVHYIVDYSSMLCTLCTHKLHILAHSLTSDCSPGLLDRAVYNTICCNYAIRSYASCDHLWLWLPCGTRCSYKCAHNVTGSKSCSHAICICTSCFL